MTMIKFKYLIVTIFLLSSSLFAVAVNRGPERYYKHLVGLDFLCTYTNMLHTRPLEYGLAQGTYGGFGFVYEYNRQRLLLQTGVNFSLNSRMVTVANDSIIREKIIDTQNDPYRHKYVFENRVDNSYAKFIEVPFLIGQKYANFYYLGGLKLNILLKSCSYIETEVTTTGLQDRDIDEFHDMYNHALFRNRPVNVLNDGIDFKLGAAACFETGYNYSSYDYRNTGYGHKRGKEYVFRFAFYAEYGLPIVPQIKSRNLDLYTIYDKDPVNVDGIKMNHLYYTFAKNTVFQNVNVGVKLTVLFGVFAKPCENCQKMEHKKKHSTKGCAHCKKQRKVLQQKK